MGPQPFLGIYALCKFINNTPLNIIVLIDPPRPKPNRWSLFSRMVSVRPYVRKKTRCNANVGARENKIRAKTDTMCEDNDHLLAMAWWVILNSLDLF